jgi:hypothetical protein
MNELINGRREGGREEITITRRSEDLVGMTII